MTTEHLCPKCASNEYIIDESNIEFSALTGDLSQGILTAEISEDSDLTLICSSCSYQYKNGDYQRKQDKVMAARLALMATQNGNQLKAVAIYALLSVLIAVFAYKFFVADRTTFGYIFSAVALVLSGIAITGLIFTPKRK
ncbi:MAG: hypothetical protein WKF66_06465 [Pedobacter sp.]